MNVGTPELLIVLMVVLLIFGPSKLPGLARSMGRTVRQFRDELDGPGKSADPEDDATPR
jgi:sec-independent protein translocase protein TatA